MSAARKKKGRKKPARGSSGSGRQARPRNPFAGRPRSGGGFHSPDKYDKKERRRLRQETEKEVAREE